MGGFTSAFLELFKKAKLDKSLGIHYNGADNMYPQMIENLIAESVTAASCSELMAAYIIGKGFDGNNDLIVNDDKGTTLFKFGTEISESLTNHKGVYIHVNYNTELNIRTMDVLPFTDCRLGKQDSNKYSGKIAISEDWGDKKASKKATKIDVYNPDKVVIQEQIDTAGGLKQYKGQVYYYNESKFIYPLSPLHPAVNDADAEKAASIYKYTSLKKGFFGKTLVVTKPLVDGMLLKGSKDDIAEHADQVKERSDFRDTLQKFIGAENADGVLHVELEMESDELDKEILFKNIESNINDKLFAFTEQSVRSNIRMRFNNVPGALIEDRDGKLFGNSGQAIKAMQLFYQDETLNERFTVTQIVNRLLKLYKEPREGLQITPLVDKPVEVQPVNKKKDVN